MANGKVKWFSNQNRYDFIQKYNVENIFEHFSAVKTEEFKTIGQSEGQKGPQTANVTAKYYLHNFF